jgi:hypothetical protein
MSYYPVDHFASGQMRLSATEGCFGRYEEYQEAPIDVCDLVHSNCSPLKHLTFFFLAHTGPVAFWLIHRPSNVSA